MEASFRQVKEKLLHQLTNFGQPIIEVIDGELREPRRAAAGASARRHRSQAGLMPRRPSRTWPRCGAGPSNLVTRVEEKGVMLRTTG